MSKLKIAFSGIGAVGGYYGGKMAAHYKGTDKVDIYFISRGKNLQKIKENGLLIKEKSKELLAIPTCVTDKAADIGPVDYLFLSTKSYDLDNNLDQLQPLIAHHTIIIPLLNGADISERIRKTLPHNRVWKGCVYIGARLKEPGIIDKFSEKDSLYFGDDKENDEQQKQLLQLLLEAGINAINPEDIDQRIWKKFFMISIAGTITSYFNLTIGEAIEQNSDIFNALGKELKKVADEKGINLPEDIVQSSIEAQKMMPVGATTSMHADFINGKDTELETLTGYVVREAKRLKIDAPHYTYMYNQLKENPYPLQ